MSTWVKPFMLLALLGVTAAHAKNVCPINPAWPFRACFFSQMPLYDQTNPNLAVLVVPDATFAAETYVDSDGHQHKPVDATVINPCRSANPIDNPYYKSWLPVGPVAGDPASLWTAPTTPGACAWVSSLTATCVPTSEAMAVMAEINAKNAATQISGWMLNSFLIGTADPAQPGYLDLSAPKPSPTGALLHTPPALLVPAGGRPVMSWTEIQRVANMAIQEHTNPDSGGGAGFPTTRLNDFQPAATTQSFNDDQVTFASATGLISAGVAPIVGIYEYTVHVQNATHVSGYVMVGGKRQPVTTPIPNVFNVTFSFNGGGHIVAINGFFTGPPNALLAYDPNGGVRTWMPLANLEAKSYSKPGGLNNLPITRTVQLPGGKASLAYWVGNHSDQTFLTDPWDLQDGDQITILGSMGGIAVQ